MGPIGSTIVAEEAILHQLEYMLKWAMQVKWAHLPLKKQNWSEPTFNARMSWVDSTKKIEYIFSSLFLPLTFFQTKKATWFNENV